MNKIARRRFLKRVGGLGALGLVASYPVFIERYLVLTNTYRIPVPNLPRAFAGFRIVHLTDLHFGFLVPLSLIRSVVARANRIERDLIACTGDYVHEKKATVVTSVYADETECVSGEVVAVRVPSRMMQR